MGMTGCRLPLSEIICFGLALCPILIHVLKSIGESALEVFLHLWCWMWVLFLTEERLVVYDCIPAEPAGAVAASRSAS